MRTRAALIVILLITLTSANLRVVPQTLAGRQQRGPTVGRKLPEFKARDQFGRDQTLDSLMGRKGLVLLFVRSADWCPYCKEQLVQLQKAQSKFLQQGLK